MSVKLLFGRAKSLGLIELKLCREIVIIYLVWQWTKACSHFYYFTMLQCGGCQITYMGFSLKYKITGKRWVKLKTYYELCLAVGKKIQKNAEKKDYNFNQATYKMSKVFKIIWNNSCVGPIEQCRPIVYKEVTFLRHKHHILVIICYFKNLFKLSSIIIFTKLQTP